MRFEFATATRIIFGEGTAATLPDLAHGFGTRPLVVTGASSERTESLVAALSAETFAVPGEPTVDLVREGARHAVAADCDVVHRGGGQAGSAWVTGSNQRLTGIARHRAYLGGNDCGGAGRVFPL
jgi:alcohol dehydrogenase class IV